MDRNTPAATNQTARRPIKGSWQDLFLQAQELARNYNDQAIPLYRKVVDGLLALPAERRRAGNNQLHNLLMAAALDLQGYYTIRERYDDALQVLEQARAVADEGEQEMLTDLRAEILLMAGRSDEALAEIRAVAESPEGELGDWGELVMAYVRAGRAAEALAVLDEMEQRLEATGNERDDYTYILGLRGLTSVEAGDVDAGIQAFEQVIELGGAYAQHLHLLYGRLVNLGRYEDALRFIDRDMTRPIRAKFWRAVALRHQGETSTSRRLLEEIVQTDISKTDQPSVVEYLLAHYYLGDEKGEGLETVLRALQDQQATSWVLLFLAGLGWAVRGDLRTAKSNFQLAVTQRKSMAEGKLLPNNYWFFTQDVVKPEYLDSLRRYFEGAEASSTEEPPPSE